MTLGTKEHWEKRAWTNSGSSSQAHKSKNPRNVFSKVFTYIQSLKRSDTGFYAMDRKLKISDFLQVKNKIYPL